MWSIPDSVTLMAKAVLFTKKKYFLRRSNPEEHIRLLGMEVLLTDALVF